MVTTVTEFFAGLAEGFATPAGQIISVLVALTLLLVAYNALVAALRTTPEAGAVARKSAAGVKAAKPSAATLPRAA